MVLKQFKEVLSGSFNVKPFSRLVLQSNILVPLHCDHKDMYDRSLGFLMSSSAQISVSLGKYNNNIKSEVCILFRSQVIT